MGTNAMNERQFDAGDLEECERDWPVKLPDVTREVPPEETLLVKAHAYFSDKITLADQIAIRCVELGVTGEVTKETYDKSKIIVGLCRKARGDIERNRKAANEDALLWQRAINGRAKELVAAIESIETPYKNGIKAIDDEKERQKLAKEQADRQAIIDAENARLEAERIKEAEQRRAEAEANRKEQERLMVDRAALEEERKRLADEQAEKDRIAKEERDKLNAELQKKLDIERAAFELERKQANEAKLANERRIQAELAERKKIEDAARAVQQAEMAKIEEELAAFRRAKFAEEQKKEEAAKAEAKRIAKEAAEKAEAERLARIAPDAEKLRIFGGYLDEAIREHCPESISSDEAKAMMQRVVMDLAGIVSDLQHFGKLPYKGPTQAS